MSGLKFMQALASFFALGAGTDTPGPDHGLISMVLGHWVEPLWVGPSRNEMQAHDVRGERHGEWMGRNSYYHCPPSSLLRNYKSLPGATD